MSAGRNTIQNLHTQLFESLAYSQLIGNKSSLVWDWLVWVWVHSMSNNSMQTEYSCGNQFEKHIHND